MMYIVVTMATRVQKYTADRYEINVTEIKGVLCKQT